MLGNLNLSLARRTMLRQLGWAADYDGATENLQITNPKNVYSGEYSLKADFANDVVGQAPAGWTVGSGAYQVKQYDITTDNKVANGGFDTDTWWAKTSTDVKILDGYAVFNNVGAYQGFYKDGILTSGKYYEVTFTVSDYVSGTIYVTMGGTDAYNTIKSANGTYKVRGYCGYTNQKLTLLTTSTTNNTFKIDNVSAYELQPLESITNGGKYLECTTAGIISIPCNQAYGRWSFDWYKGNDANLSIMGLMADRVGGALSFQGYLFFLASDEAISLRTESVGSSVAKFRTNISYMPNNTWCHFDIYRLTNGQFSVYISGGSFGNTPVLISTAGGSGTNPVTDNTYVSSNFFVLDLDQGDRIANIKCEYASGSLDLFGWERFLHSGNRDFERPVNLGPELAINGSLSTPTNWTTSGNTVVNNGTATMTGASAALSQSIPNLQNGAVYELNYDVVGTPSLTVSFYLSVAGFGALSQAIPSNSGQNKVYVLCQNSSQPLRFATNSGETGAIVLDNISLKQVLSDWQKVGNHDCYVTGEDKYSGAYCLKVISTAAGDANNCIWIAADKFLTLTSGKKFCSQRRVKANVDCSMYVQFGDKVVTRAITGGSWVLTPWTFEATANTVNQPCKVWFDRAVTAYIDEINLAEHFPTTWNVWFRTTNPSSSLMVIMSKLTSTTIPTAQGFALRMVTTGEVNFAIYDANSSRGLNGGAYNDGKWHLYTVTYDASLPASHVKLFIDGIFRVQTDYFMGNSNNTQPLTIGRNSYNSLAFWSGQLGQIQQVRAIKTASQILADFKNGITRRTDSMLNLKFSGPDDSTFLKDYSPLQQLVTGINITKADQVRGSYPYFSK